MRGSLLMRVLGKARAATVIATLCAPLITLRAQSAPVAIPPLAAQADSLFRLGDAVGSLTRANEGVRRNPSDYASLWRAARSEIMLGIIEGDRAIIEGHYARATALARRAVALQPGDTAGHFWLAAVLGRRALRADFRTGLPLASEAYIEARRVLVIDSLHAGAHEILGRLHQEVRKLPSVVRVLAGLLSGLEVIRNASWQASEWHLRRAMALDPSAVLPHADLALLYLRMGRRADAEREVQQLERMPRRTPADAFFQGDARKRLAHTP
ncbi:MAG: hypothetical protein WCK74_05835 [Gemmatimonadaceae bacterium]